MKKYKLSTRISVYIAVILSLAMSGLTIRSLIVKRNVHSVSVTLYGIVFVSLLVVSAVSLIVYIYKSKIGIYVSIACLVIIFAYGIIMKDSPLVGREPEGVGEGVGQRADGARTQYGPHVGVGQLAALRRVDAAAEVGDRPEHEQDAEGARQRVHGVDHQRHVLGRGCQHRGQTRHHHEQRGSGRMSHFELVGGGNELRAVPEACRRFHGGQVGQRRDGEDCPSHDVVPTVVTFHADRLRV